VVNKTGYTGAISSTGVPVLQTFVDNGDGTYARKITTVSGAGVIVYQYGDAAAVAGLPSAPIPTLFVAQGDGTYAELVSAS
jgi:hypothetical protein